MFSAEYKQLNYSLKRLWDFPEASLFFIEKMETIHIQEQLSQFHGTESYHRHFLANKVSILLTDGAEFIREKGQCNWLFDFIVAYQTHKDIKNQRFQVWTLQKQNMA